ncbi:MAG: glycosyltransferase family 2 protein [Xanthobacteraceae bacterium]
MRRNDDKPAGNRAAPRVCIGMPVLNAEMTIALALNDLIAQTFRDLEILVFDNASQDRTVEIATEFARRDARVRVIGFDQRVDILESFKRALQNSRGEYFMFAPADDRWYPRFVEQAVALLDARPEVAACCCRIAYVSDRRFRYISTGTRPLTGSHRHRLRSYFADPAENGRAFGVYRRAAMMGKFPGVWFPGWDFVLVARTLAHGNHAELPVVLMERDLTPLKNYIAEFDRYYAGRWPRWLPLLPVARAMFRRPAAPFDLGLFWNLLVFVLRSHVTYAVHRARRWGPFVKRFDEFVRLDRWPVNAPLRAAAQQPNATTDGESPSAPRSSRISA